jgi:hypothetical protein
MQQDLKAFWAAFKRATTARQERPTLPTACPALSPWAFWLLIALVQHRTRQRWVADVVKNHLRGDPDALAAAGSFGHPKDISRHGIVPGMPEWEYCFHGRGCELTHRITGESIDVDFYMFDLFEQAGFCFGCPVVRHQTADEVDILPALQLQTLVSAEKEPSVDDLVDLKDVTADCSMCIPVARWLEHGSISLVG